MFTLKVIKAEKVFRDDKYQMEVEFQLVQGKTVEPRILAFPLIKTEKEIKLELKKYLDTFNQDADRAIQTAKESKASQEADKTIKNLEGFKA